jgi:hypothetical protein
MKANTSFKGDLIQKTIDVWQPSFTQSLQPADAEEIIVRWSSLVSIAAQSLNSARQGVQHYSSKLDQEG